MRFSEAWLREWVNPAVSTSTLASQLTMAGLEVGSVEPAAPAFSGVVLGRVIAVDAHPNAEKLQVCKVDTGQDQHLQIVCGAPNVAVGQLVAVAQVGAKLPGLKIRKAKLRGVASAGMICSGSELGLSEESDGILVLTGDGALGSDVRDYLQLDDQILELELTPNRGDCLGITGIAREVGVLNRCDVKAMATRVVDAQCDASVPVELADPRGCPVYAGRVVRGINPDAQTPLWMCERLRRSGLRPIHPVVDITNYVMLETGQPMHAFDLRQLDGGIIVRRAVEAEKLMLLDGREITLDTDILVIADHKKVKALAGVMGGVESGVEADTTDIFFESAYFDPLVIAGRARRFGLHTDASHRFERGVAPGLQAHAIERATELLIEIAGGTPGPLQQASAEAHIPVRAPVLLRRERLARLLGVQIADDRVVDILTRLGMTLAPESGGWLATPPAFRFDINIEADLIEEVVRIYGYDNIPEVDAGLCLSIMPETERRIPLARLESMLAARGYQEVITYSFVDPQLHEDLFGVQPALALSNPISSDLSVMRTSLWPGLIGVLKHNISRQQERIHIFESGLRFIPEDDEIKQEKCLSGLMYGTRLSEQWGERGADADFYDIKADVEAMLALTGKSFVFEAAVNAALHPAQTARVCDEDGVPVGYVGTLHPALQRQLGLSKPVFLFEILVQAAFHAKIPLFEAVSRYPSLRRDISFLVDESVTAADVLNCVKHNAADVLRDARIFDVYRDKSIDSGRKSVALGLILQDYCSTLTDGDADAAVDRIRTALVANLKAKIRD